jgi:glucokinase
VYIGNDADLAGLGEYTLGAGRDVGNLIYITISTGIGGGLIERGQILTGRGLGGEVGHMVIEPGGPICNCGKQGHLEAVASGTAIGRDARQRLAAGEKSLLSGMVDGDIEAITAREVGKAALQGDRLAQSIIAQAGRYIGMSIASLMMLLNPDMFVLGGGVTKVGDLLFGPIDEAVREYAMHPRYYEGIPIVPTQLGPDVGLYGSAALVQLKARG